jgi:hypothetical protein
MIFIYRRSRVLQDTLYESTGQKGLLTLENTITKLEKYTNK